MRMNAAFRPRPDRDKVRVLHLINGLGRGGAEVLLAQGLRHRDAARFEYGYAYFLNYKGELAPDLAAHGAAFTRCLDARSAAEILLKLPAVRALLREWRPRVLHCHLPLAGVVGRIAARLAGIPVVYTEHNVASRYHPLTRAANTATWRLVDRAVAVSGEVAQSIRRSVGTVRPVDVVRNGVSCEWFQQGARGGAVRRQLGVPDDAPVIGTVAVFRKQKCLDVWLRMAKLVRARHRELRCIVVGDGPLREQLEHCARREGIADVTYFVGIQSDVRPYLDAMDVYVMSSAFEGQPVALLEAMAMSVPAVSTAVGGIPELIDSGASGLLVPGPDAGALAAQVDRLLADPEQRASLATAARGTIEREFSVQSMTRHLESIYVDLLERRA